MLLCLAESNMIMFQASPVEHLIKSRKAVPKSLKLACQFKPSCYWTKPNWETPIMAYKKRSKRRRRPREAILGSDSIKV